MAHGGRRPARLPLAWLPTAVWLACCAPPACVRAARCPEYEHIANIKNPLIANFSMDKFLGHWVEVRSHNVPGLTTGCACTRYNCKEWPWAPSPDAIPQPAASATCLAPLSVRVVVCPFTPWVVWCGADTGSTAAWVEHFSCCRKLGAARNIGYYYARQHGPPSHSPVHALYSPSLARVWIPRLTVSLTPVGVRWRDTRQSVPPPTLSRAASRPSSPKAAPAKAAAGGRAGPARCRPAWTVSPRRCGNVCFLRCRFILKTIFYQDRLGTNIGETPKIHVSAGLLDTRPRACRWVCLWLRLDLCVH